MTQLLGGAASPIGWSVQYLDAGLDRVVDALGAIRSNKVDVTGPFAYQDLVYALPPFEAPWTREVVMPCGAWTAYLNNFVNGGDPSAVGPAVSRALGVRCVVAVCSPRHGPGHQSTQLSVIGPDGEPPLSYERAIAAQAEDGRWTWNVSGVPFVFEEQERYTARRIRDRFDRALLLQYLAHLGIPAGQDSAYGSGFVVQERVSWSPRTVTLQEARDELLSP